jgi:hypothetical protein
VWSRRSLRHAPSSTANSPIASRSVPVRASTWEDPLPPAVRRPISIRSTNWCLYPELAQFSHRHRSRSTHGHLVEHQGGWPEPGVRGGRRGELAPPLTVGAAPQTTLDGRVGDRLDTRLSQRPQAVDPATHVSASSRHGCISSRPVVSDVVRNPAPRRPRRPVSRTDDTKASGRCLRRASHF